MNQVPSINLVLRWAMLATALVSLSACQKAKMSSVDHSQRQQQPPPYYPPGHPPIPPPGGGTPPPGYPPGGGVPVPPPVVNPGNPGNPGYPPPNTTPQPQGPVVPPRLPPRQPPVTPGPSAQPVTPPPPVTPLPTMTPVPSPVTPTPVAPVAPPTTSVPTQAPGLVTIPYTAPVAPVTPVAPVGIIGSQGGLISVHKSGDQPVLLGNLRVITPSRSDVVKTCARGECGKPEKIFTTDCANPRNERECNIQTVIVPRKDQITCPAIQLRQRPYTDKLDILFVVDTSASMKEERTEIARQMTNFINELSPDVDYRIAVMLGHGPRSKAIQVGEIYQTDPTSNTGVLKKSHLSPEQIIHALATRMQSVPNDNSEVQGEAGLLNLYTAVTDSGKLAQMKSQGFWRDEAAKAVIFVADENDVCFDYEAESARVGHVVKARAKKVAKGDTYGRDPVEIDSFNRSDVCANVINGKRLTPKLVFDAVAKSSSMPVAYSGILYLDNKSIPLDKNDTYAADNEMGRGYLEVVSLGFGKAAELAQRDFGKSLAKMGDFTNFKMKYDHIFPMLNVKDVTDIDPLTVSIAIADTSTKQINLFESPNVVLETDKATNTANVVIAYEVIDKVYADGRVKPDSKIVIWYSTKSGSMETLKEVTPVPAVPQAAAGSSNKQDPHEGTEVVGATDATATASATPSAPAEAKSAETANDGSFIWKIPSFSINAHGDATPAKGMEIQVTPRSPFNDNTGG